MLVSHACPVVLFGEQRFALECVVVNLLIVRQVQAFAMMQAVLVSGSEWRGHVRKLFPLETPEDDEGVDQKQVQIHAISLVPREPACCWLICTKGHLAPFKTV